ncbi:MAG: Rab family GTPase [Candidatus Thorarchaeota archaeon]
MAAREPDFVYKLVFLGDTGVGKTSLVQRYVYDSLPTDLGSTIGAMLHVKLVSLRGVLYKLVIWDLGGQESFAQLREQYCANASGAFFVFDRTRPETLRSVGTWLEALYSAAGRVPVVMIENKIDLEPVVDPREVMEVAERMATRLIQTSATQNMNVDLAFTGLVEAIRAEKEQT